MFLLGKKPTEPERGCLLKDIRLDGRIVTFTFERNGEAFTIETISTWGDDLAKWRRLAGLDR